jgi:hypothetical protein
MPKISKKKVKRPAKMQGSISRAPANGSNGGGAPQAQVSVSNLKKALGEISMDKPLESGGEALGRRLGAFAGRILGKITGMGDYEVSSLTSSGGGVVPETLVPEFIKTDNAREVRIRHREFIGTVNASSIAGTFDNTSYPLNPGMAQTFPWLSQIAQGFEQWRPNGMVVLFKSLSSTYAATQSLGHVILATDYDPYDSPYGSSIEMENSQFAVASKTSDCLAHPVECAMDERATRVLFTRTNDAVRDLMFTDLGNLQVATEGCLANQLVGQLWITYDISFFKPQLNSGFPLIDSYQDWFSSAASAGAPTTIWGGVIAKARDGLGIQTSGTQDVLIPTSLKNRYLRFEIWASGWTATCTTTWSFAYVPAVQNGPLVWDDVSVANVMHPLPTIFSLKRQNLGAATINTSHYVTFQLYVGDITSPYLYTLPLLTPQGTGGTCTLYTNIKLNDYFGAPTL